ncbi:MAG: E3 binding domain-containing protein, partial [Clostridia bacterium]|nr:E3 binding domain-containing protein [Clostridia bacterium]
MANGVLMPKQGITVESCILTSWHVKVGDTVKKGDILFSYETDKSAFDQESEFDGEVLALFCEEGDEVPVLTNVLVIGNKGEDYSALAPSGVASSEAKEEAPKVEEVKEEAPKAEEATQQAVVSDDGRIFASPRAKNLANKLGVDLATATPTGPNGRIIESDVRKASVNPAPVKVASKEKVYTMDDFKAFKDEKMPNIRKVIAKGMMNSLSSMAQLTMNISFDCTNVMELRKFFKANEEKLNLPPITINHIIIFALS